MIRLGVIRHVLAAGRLGLGFWALGLGAMMAMLVLLWPSYREFQLEAMVAEIPEAFRALFMGRNPLVGQDELARYAQFLYLEWLAFSLPLAVTLYALFGCGGAIAREADQGTLDLLLAQPVSRAALVLSKYVGFLVGLGLVLGVTALVQLGLERMVADVPALPAGRVLGAGLLAWLLGAAFGGLALVSSALWLDGRRALGAAGGLLFFMWLARVAGVLSERAEPVANLSLFYHWEVLGLLVEGTVPWGLAAAYAVTALGGVALAVWLFHRRELA